MALDESEMRVVLNSGLFQGLRPEEVEALFPHLRPRRATFEKDDVILSRGDNTRAMGLVLSGIVHEVQEDFWGARRGGKAALSGLLPGDLFAEAYALLPDVPLKVNVLAAAPGTVVLFLDLGRLAVTPLGAEPPSGINWEEPQTRLVQNLLAIMARKSLVLSRRAEIFSKRTIRERLLSYLSNESFHRGSAVFEIPFSRQELADHLLVNRCSLSSEITKLKEEGILKCRGRKFVMLRPGGEKIG